MTAVGSQSGRNLREAEAAELAGLARSTFAKLRITGGGPPFVRINSSVRYPEADLVAWLASLPRLTRTREPERVADSTSSQSRRVARRSP
jgi:predicted DNA-binding transcriptional regulator AlpA